MKYDDDGSKTLIGMTNTSLFIFYVYILSTEN